MKNIIIILSILLCSCGARKTETTKKEETTKTDFSGFFRNSGISQEFLKTDLDLQTNFNSNLMDLSKVNSYEFTFEPEDKTKPAVYTDPSGQKHTVENGKLTRKNTTEEKNINSGNSGNSQLSQKSDLVKKDDQQSEGTIKGNSEATSSEKNKKAEREQWSLWNLLWLLIPIVLVFAVWKLWKNYKKINPLV